MIVSSVISCGVPSHRFAGVGWQFLLDFMNDTQLSDSVDSDFDRCFTCSFIFAAFTDCRPRFRVLAFFFRVFVLRRAHMFEISSRRGTRPTFDNVDISHVVFGNFAGWSALASAYAFFFFWPEKDQAKDLKVSITFENFGQIHWCANVVLRKL
jgi:hypothetical protein